MKNTFSAVLALALLMVACNDPAPKPNHPKNNETDSTKNPITQPLTSAEMIFENDQFRISLESMSLQNYKKTTKVAENLLDRLSKTEAHPKIQKKASCYSISLDAGGTKDLCKEGEQHSELKYVGFAEEMNAYLFESHWVETHIQYLIINAQDGSQTTIAGRPSLSPDGAWLVGISNEAISWAGFEFYKLIDQKIEKIGVWDSFEHKEGALSFKPMSFIWAADNAFLAIAEKTTEGKEVPYKFTLVQK